MDYDDERQLLNFMSGLLLGAVIGAGLALLTAPQSGRRTRGRIKKTARRIRASASNRLDDLADEMKGKVDEVIGGAREHFSSR